MPYPGNTCRAVFQFLLPNGSHGYVTPHFRTFDGTDYDNAGLAALGAMLEDWWDNADFQGEGNLVPMKNFFNENSSLEQIILTSLDPTAPPQHVQPVGIAGLNTSAPLPNETALVVTLYTGLVGRSFRGRNFWPGLSTNLMQDNGTLLDLTVSGLQENFDALINGLATEANNVVAVHSTFLGQVNQVISCVVRDTLHHQRRRNS